MHPTTFSPRAFIRLSMWLSDALGALSGNASSINCWDLPREYIQALNKHLEWAEYDVLLPWPPEMLPTQGQIIDLGISTRREPGLGFEVSEVRYDYWENGIVAWITGSIKDEQEKRLGDTDFYDQGTLKSLHALGAVFENGISIKGALEAGDVSPLF